MWLLWLKNSEKIQPAYRCSVATLAKKLRKKSANVAILAIFVAILAKNGFRRMGEKSEDLYFPKY